jgi:8-oxo-dGTP pyrophosphatase MutT (NUDIX family)
MSAARFVAFHDRPEPAPGDAPAPRFAVMIAHTANGVLLVSSRVRKVWELPGGLIDRGESARAAAIRELREESGCVALETRWLGMVEVQDGALQLGAVLACRVDRVPPTFSNEETVALGHWNANSSPSPLGQADEALLRRFG